MNDLNFRKLFTGRFVPEGTPEHEKWFDELQRVSTSAENAAHLMEIDDDIDVRPLLPAVTAPTLVVHCDRDHAVSPERGGFWPPISRGPATCHCRAPTISSSKKSRLADVPRGVGTLSGLERTVGDRPVMPRLHTFGSFVVGAACVAAIADDLRIGCGTCSA